MHYTLDSLEHRVKMLENKYKRKVIYQPYFSKRLGVFDEVNLENDIYFFGLLTIGNLKIDSEGIDKPLNKVMLYSSYGYPYLEVESNSQLVCLFSHMKYNYGDYTNFVGIEPSEEIVEGLFEGFMLIVTQEPLPEIHSSSF